jgi:predicted double-glycine peptidase
MPYCLYSALKNRYSQDGLQCQYRSFDSVEQLRGAGLTLAVVKDEFLSDHCVAVLKVSKTMVKLADPTLGLISVTHEQFKQMWRYRGITLKRNPS